MVKKMLVLGLALVTLFLFTACGYPTKKFDSLAEMQAAFPKDVYYFDFEQEGITEAGKYEAERTSNKKLEDGSYHYIRYSVWYDVEYTIDGQKQERKLRIVAANERYSMSFGYNSTMAFNSKLASTIESMELIGFSGRIGFDDKKKIMLCTINITGHNYFYYFILDEVKVDFIEKEVEIFLSIWSLATMNRYQIS